MEMGALLPFLYVPRAFFIERASSLQLRRLTSSGANRELSAFGFSLRPHLRLFWPLLSSLAVAARCTNPELVVQLAALLAFVRLALPATTSHGSAVRPRSLGRHGPFVALPLIQLIPLPPVIRHSLQAGRQDRRASPHRGRILMATHISCALSDICLGALSDLTCHDAVLCVATDGKRTH